MLLVDDSMPYFQATLRDARVRANGGDVDSPLKGLIEVLRRKPDAGFKYDNEYWLAKASGDAVAKITLLYTFTNRILVLVAVCFVGPARSRPDEASE